MDFRNFGATLVVREKKEPAGESGGLFRRRLSASA
jgi:hypothetical protein